MTKRKFYVHCTVNTPKGEVDYSHIETDSLDETLQMIVQHHPSATSMVLSVVPNIDNYAVFGDLELHER